MGTGVNGSGMAICAIKPVNRLKAMTRPTSIASDRSGIHARINGKAGAVRTQKS
jgi:hypothetical protein